MALIARLQNKYALVDRDPWTLAGEAIPDGADVIVPVERFDETFLARSGRTGVQIPSDQGLEPVLPFVARLALIAIEFPKHVDGRGYSLARLLRERHGYRGELRAVGNVLRDNLLFMHRCGFDAFELDPKYGPGGLDPKSALSAFDDFDVFYQAASDVRLPLWKRVQRA